MTSTVLLTFFQIRKIKLFDVKKISILFVKIPICIDYTKSENRESLSHAKSTFNGLNRSFENINS